MIIKKLIASFGLLEDKALHLEPGLNIIYAQNEEGKSSFTAFIRAMLYGIHTKERDKAGHLTEKNKFRPWSGRQMEGIMDIEWEGRSVSIQRTNLGQSPMKKLNVRYTGTGQEVLELMHENLGETLLKTPEEVFTSGAFIRQGGLKVTQSGSLEQRIAALASSGEEDVSYFDVEKTLATYKRKCKNKTGGGLIPTLEKEISQLDSKLEEIRDKSGIFYETSRDLERSIGRIQELLQDKETHEELEQRAKRQKIQNLGGQITEKNREIQEIEKNIATHARDTTEEKLQTARTYREALAKDSLTHGTILEEKKQAESQLALLDETKGENGFHGQSISQAKETVSDISFQRAAAQEKSNFPKTKRTIPMGILSVLTLACLSVHYVTDFPAIWFAIVFALGFLFFAGKLFHDMRVAKSLLKRSDEHLRPYKATTIAELEAHFAEYERLCLEAEKVQALVLEKTEMAENSFQEMEMSKTNFLTAVHNFAPFVSHLEEAYTLVDILGKLADRLQLLLQERNNAQLLYDNLQADYVGDSSLPIPEDNLVAPLRTKSETLFELDRLQKEYDKLKEAHDIAFGEVKILGDPLRLSAQKESLEQEKEKQIRIFNALEFSMEILSQADGEMRSRYSPKLSERAGQYLDFLTNGAYKRVLFDRDLHPSVEQAGENISRDALYLSGGTQDQVYLALRLALCDLTFGESCPIILDDALVSFDEARMKRAVDLLLELSKTRQVLLFSCHVREAAYAKEKTGVHLATLA